MNIRVAVSAATGDGRLDPMIPSGAPAMPHGTRRLSMGEVPLYRRATLVEGQIITGPAVVEDGMSTLLVPPGAVATQEANGNLVVELPA
jgi:N-methylhydantoinase A